MLAASIALHILVVIVWIGGMFFAHFVLRPVVNQLLTPSSRLTFLTAIFARFFTVVWIAIVLLWLTGGTVVFLQGGVSQMPPYIHVMLAIASVMTFLFMYLFFIPYTRLEHATEAVDFEEGMKQLAYIRRIILINLILGIITTIIGMVGKYIPLLSTIAT